MDDLKPRLEKLGRDIAETSEKVADPKTLDRVRHRFLASTAPRAVRRQDGVRRGALAVAFTAALLVLAIVFFARRPAAVSFFVDGSAQPGVLGNWIAADAQSLGIRFSEGSRLVVEPGARMRVTETRADGAGILIERGTIRADIVHQTTRTSWAVKAGPFEIKVTGTSFSAQWDPASETFELTMKGGSVLAMGPLLESGRTLVAGERVRVSVRDKKLELSAISSVDTVPEPATSAEPIEVAPPVPSGDSPKGTSTSAASAHRPEKQAIAVEEKKESPAWRELAASGKYKDALAAAEQAGFSNEIERAPASDLYILADAARFSGSPGRAKEALLALRRRFGAPGKSAFLLGKVAADQQNSPGEAVTWFETYLREEPGGPLAEQALGRVLEIKKRSDHAGARTVADRYLARYPQGAYAALAKSILSSQ